MSASFLPTIFVPFVGIIGPLLFITSFFKFLEQEEIK